MRSDPGPHTGVDDTKATRRHLGFPECPVGLLGNLDFTGCPAGRPGYQALLTLPETWTA
jgi:hypothetical protein